MYNLLFTFAWRALLMQRSMYSLTHPTAGQPGGYHGGFLGFAVCSSPWGVGVFSSFVPMLESRDLSLLKKHSVFFQVTAIK